MHQLLAGRTDLRILEVGSWLGGGSTQVLARFAAELVCVDHWGGNRTDAHRGVVESADPIELFRRNTAAFSERLVMVVADSVVAATLLPDYAFDFIFIDADHRYQCVRADLLAYLPKLRRGGVIAGHDCEGRVSSGVMRFTEDQLTVDSIRSPIQKFTHLHPGVIVAVHEVFGDRAFLFSDDENKFDSEAGEPRFSTIWAVAFEDAPAPPSLSGSLLHGEANRSIARHQEAHVGGALETAFAPRMQ